MIFFIVYKNVVLDPEKCKWMIKIIYCKLALLSLKHKLRIEILNLRYFMNYNLLMRNITKYYKVLKVLKNINKSYTIKQNI